MNHISIKYNRVIMEFDTKKSISEEDREYIKKSRKKIKAALDKINIFQLFDDGNLQQDVENEKEEDGLIPIYGIKRFYTYGAGKKKEPSLTKINVRKITEETLLEGIGSKKYRYSESRLPERFLFYNDIVKELRSISVGTTNFLVCKSLKKYETRSTINLDDFDSSDQVDVEPFDEYTTSQNDDDIDDDILF